MRSTLGHQLLQLRCRFLQLWQGLLTDGHTRIVVLAATNLPGLLDPAAVRRFGCKLEVSLRQPLRWSLCPQTRA